MEKKVTVLTPHGRRHNVKVSPNTTLLQVLEEACQRYDFDSNEYGLQHHNKDVDLTQMFRFTGLPNNCMLEMVKAERKRLSDKVEICLQLEDNTRMQGQFSPNDNLWFVVQTLCANTVDNYQSPVAIYMRQEIIGQEKMSGTALKSLGITEGRALVRIFDKKPEELKTQANVYVAPVVKDAPSAEQRKTSATTAGAGSFAITKDLVKELKKAATEPSAAVAAATEEPVQKPTFDWNTGVGRTMQASQTSMASQEDNERVEREKLEKEMEAEVNIIGERNAIIYSLDATQRQMEDVPDSFFDLTVHDLKLVLRDLKKIAAGTAEAPLLTEKLREMQENKTMLNKIGQYKNCVIRIQFPDRHVLQGLFKPIDTVQTVADFVRIFLKDKTLKFHLFTIPPKRILPMDKTLLEMDFVPTALLHLGLAEDTAGKTLNSWEQTFISSEFLQKLTTAEGAIYAANKYRISHRRMDQQLESNEGTDIEQSYVHRSPTASTGAIPKQSRADSSSSVH